MRKTNILIVLVFAITAVAPTALSAQKFDKPIRKQVVDFGPSPDYAGPDVPHIKLSCYFYRTFAVKELDDGQKGAALLAIAPMRSGVPAKCERSHAVGEKVIDPKEWIGYYMGVKGRLVFFSADDGVNGAMPFAIYDATTQKKIFEDSHYESTMWNRRPEPSPFNHLRVFETPDGQSKLVYLRSGEADCDLPLKGEECWQRTRKKYNIVETKMPNCSGYEAKEIQMYRPYSSAIVYPVEVTLFPQPVTKTIAGPVKCWPVD
jgi:hypothetical protein